MNQVIIVDEMMGSGKSTAAINYINESTDERFIVITPYLEEVKRYIECCSSKHFREPIKKRGKKITDFKDLIKKGRNVVCTHALFQRFDDEIISICRALNYTMIMDEVAEVVQEYDITTDDIKLLLSEYCYTDETGKLVWREEFDNYHGKFEEVKNLCKLGGLAIVRDKALMWLFPIEVFKAFKKTFILTYMFNAQLQRYYYDYYGIDYTFTYVCGTDLSSYHFSDYFSDTRELDKPKYNYRNLINILDNYKMNVIGEEKYALSLSWYQKYKNTAMMKQLQNNIINFFRHIRFDNTKDNIWTTYKDFENFLSAKGFARGFIPLNMRATNAYRDRTSVVYPVNRFLNPYIKGFFQDHGVDVDEDGYALSEMLQWIWRSAIRDGGEIWIYIPSSRMRELLENWIGEVSCESSELNSEEVLLELDESCSNKN